MSYIQPWRSTVTGETPVVTLPAGTLWNNIADLQLGLSDGVDPLPLLGITIFSEDADYPLGVLVEHDGVVYRSAIAIGIDRGAFDSTEWEVASLSFLELLTGGTNWNFVVTYDEEHDITVVDYSLADQRYRETPTYTDEDITTLTYEYSENSGIDYTLSATLDLTYDDNGNVLTGTWS